MQFSEPRLHQKLFLIRFQYRSDQRGQLPKRNLPPYYSSCQKFRIKDPLKATGYKDLNTRSDYFLESAVADGPVGIGMYTCPQLKQYQSGVFTYDCYTDPQKLYNYKMMIGYDRNEKWWKFRSYNGKEYGENGDVRVKKVNGEQTVGTCAVLSYSIAFTGLM